MDDHGYFPVEGGRLHYCECGSGPPLVLLPKLGGWTRDWRHIAPEFAKQFRVITIDPSGHGESVMDVEAPQQTLVVGEAAGLMQEQPAATAAAILSFLS